MMLLPITMLGSFAALFKGIGVEAYQSFIASIGAVPVLNAIYQWTTGMFAVYLAFLSPTPLPRTPSAPSPAWP